MKSEMETKLFVCSHLWKEAVTYSQYVAEKQIKTAHARDGICL